MKKIFLISNLILTYSVFSCFAQVNPATNSYSKLPEPPSQIPEPNADKLNTTPLIPCGPNVFLMATFQNNIKAFELNGNTVNYLGLASTTSNGYLAIRANEICDTSMGVTFFSANNTFSNPVTGVVFYYNGFNWTYCNGYTFYHFLANGGGNGNYIYYTHDSLGYWSHAIARYDGLSLYPIYHAPPYKFIGVADLSVDDNGNVWFFTGDSVTWMTDYLNKISPTGTLLEQYPVVFNCYNGYGTFIMNNKIYAALGHQNPVNPNTLLPISLLDSVTAVIEPPIPFPDTTGIDMEGCVMGLLVGKHELNFSSSITISPNPCGDRLEIRSSEKIFSFSLNDLNGNVTDQVEISEQAANTIKVNTSYLAPGVYILKIKTQKTFVNHKIVKI